MKSFKHVGVPLLIERGVGGSLPPIFFKTANALSPRNGSRPVAGLIFADFHP
jgi:hypothetical protein